MKSALPSVSTDDWRNMRHIRKRNIKIEAICTACRARLSSAERKRKEISSLGFLFAPTLWNTKSRFLCDVRAANLFAWLATPRLFLLSDFISFADAARLCVAFSLCLLIQMWFVFEGEWNFSIWQSLPEAHFFVEHPNRDDLSFENCKVYKWL